jgi:23S rRNA pseudouridine1911/1915/1917 synthase
MTTVHNFSVEDSNVGQRLDRFEPLLNAAGSRNQLQKLILDGRVTVNETERPARYKLRSGDTISASIPDREPTHLEPEDLPIEMVHIDSQIIVVNKSPGMVVHPGAGHPNGTLVNALLHHVPDLRGVGTQERPGLVHRLDRDTSGLMVVARTAEALRVLQEGFTERSVHRRYIAVALGRQLDDHVTFETEYGRHPSDRKKFTGKRGSKHAITHVRVLARGETLVLIDAKLETGRTHQVRVHLTESGHPIVADPVYGRKLESDVPSARGRKELQAMAMAPRLMLHAGILEFNHPVTGERLRFEQPPPPDFMDPVLAWLNEDLWAQVWEEFTLPA